MQAEASYIHLSLSPFPQILNKPGDSDMDGEQVIKVLRDMCLFTPTDHTVNERSRSQVTFCRGYQRLRLSI